MSETKLRNHRCARDLDSGSLGTMESCSLGEVSWKKG